MRSAMNEETFMKFYQNTVLGYSNTLQRHICRLLEKQHLITFDKQRHMFDTDEVLYFERRQDINNIIYKTTIEPRFINFYENWEFIKLYKYSVPIFYELPENVSLEGILQQKGFICFDKTKFKPEYILNTDLKEVKPIYLVQEKRVFLKFVLQKSYMTPETFEMIDYRYPIIIYFDTESKVLEIRYDATKYRYSSSTQIGVYEKIVNDCIEWLKNDLILELYDCNHMDIIKVVNDTDDKIKMFKQMMNMSSGGAAELTASESEDYVLPFIGELRELIDENEELFNQSEEIKELLTQYLDDKEATASYPYIYIKCIKAVETESYIVKIIFDYLNRKYTLLQHNIGNCKCLEVERMNDVIEYLCRNRAFIKGERI